MSGRGWVIFVVAWLLLPLVWWLLPDGSEDAAGRETPDPPAPAVVVEDGLTVIGDSGFARGYNDPAGTAEEDLKRVAEVLDAAFLLVKDFDRIPLADNADFTAFLQGENPHRVAWIAPGHPAVSARGELLDRWGEPLFFHRESSRRTTFRSAGPDREMWTPDDVVWPGDEER